MKKVNEVFKLKPGDSLSKGTATLQCFEINYQPSELMMINYRYARDYRANLFNIENGVYTRLLIDGGLYMSDTPMEQKSNEAIIQKATGRVFIGGLGIGLLLHNFMEKLESGEVSEIVVGEINQDVIDLVGPYFEHPKIKFWNCDIKNMRRNPVYLGERFDTIYLDIWSELGEKEYEEMKSLSRIFRYFLNKDNPNCYINCWMKEFLSKAKRQGLL